MALRKKVVPIIAGSGIDTGNDPKVAPGWVKLENGEIDVGGSVSKRKGVRHGTVVTATPISVGSVNDGTVVKTMDDGVGISNTASFDVKYSDSTDNPYRNQEYAVGISLFQSLADTGVCYNSDVVELSDCYVVLATFYVESTGVAKVVAASINKDTKTIIEKHTLQFANTPTKLQVNCGRAVEVDGECVIAYPKRDTGTIELQRVTNTGVFDISSSVSLGATTLAPSSSAAVYPFDACSVTWGGTEYCAIGYVHDTGTSYRMAFAWIDNALITQFSSVSSATDVAYPSTYECISICFNEVEGVDFSCSHYNSSTNAHTTYMGHSIGGTISAVRVASSIANLIPKNSSIIHANRQGVDGYTAFVTYFDSRKAIVSQDGVVVHEHFMSTAGAYTLEAQIEHTAMYSRPARTTAAAGETDYLYGYISDTDPSPDLGMIGSAYLVSPGKYESVVKNGSSTTSATPHIQAILANNNAGPIPIPVPHGLSTLDDDTFIASCPYIIDLSTPTTSAVGAYVAKRLEVERYVQAGDFTYISGGLPQSFGIGGCASLGLFPYKKFTLLPVLTAGGSIPVGRTPSYKTVYCRVTEGGVIERGIPTGARNAPLSPTTSGNQSYNIHLPTYPLIDEGRYSNNYIELYRTFDSSNTSYGLVDRIQCSTIGYYQVYNDTKSDTSVQANTRLYSDSQLASESPNAMHDCVSHLSRLWYIDAAFRQRVYYSKPLVESGKHEFSSALFVDVDQSSGELEALSTVNDKLVAFKRAETWVVGGYPLSAAGTGSGPDLPYLASASIGCDNRLSVVRVGPGVFFKSPDLICMLDGQYNISEIGGPVKYFTDQYPITGAFEIPGRSEVVFTTENVSLVYNWSSNAWSTFENHAAKSAASNGVSDEYLLLATNNRLWYSRDNYSDYENAQTVFIPLLAETGWISFAEIGGYQRLYRLLITGHNVTDHTLRVKIAYDFDPAWTDNLTFDSSAVQNFDHTAYYGAGLSLGAYEDQAYTIEVHPSRQKCTAVRLQISDEHPGGAVAADEKGLVINAVSALVGIKGGTQRVGEGRMIGV